jgi:hypothetical protein
MLLVLHDRPPLTTAMLLVLHDRPPLTTGAGRCCWYCTTDRP